MQVLFREYQPHMQTLDYINISNPYIQVCIFPTLLLATTTKSQCQAAQVWQNQTLLEVHVVHDGGVPWSGGREKHVLLQEPEEGQCEIHAHTTEAKKKSANTIQQ